MVACVNKARVQSDQECSVWCPGRGVGAKSCAGKAAGADAVEDNNGEVDAAPDGGAKRLSSTGIKPVKLASATIEEVQHGPGRRPPKLHSNI